MSDIADVILAEWFRVLPETGTGDQHPMDEESLTVAFNQILDVHCIAVLDGEGTEADPIKIVVPRPPRDNQQELRTYLENNSDFRVGMGPASIFGCGR